MDWSVRRSLWLTHIHSAYRLITYAAHRCSLFVAAVILAPAQIALAMPEAANPDAPVAPANYRSIIDRYKSFRPTEPKDWQAVNREVAPKTKTEPTQDAPR